MPSFLFWGQFFALWRQKKLEFCFSILQIEKKLEISWKNSEKFWNQKNENKNKNKNCFASSWAENRHQPTKSKNMDANNQQLNSKIWYELAFWGLATSVGWLLLLKKNCWVGYFLNFFGGTTLVININIKKIECQINYQNFLGNKHQLCITVGYQIIDQ